jgi:methyladenine glycosylase
MASAPPKVFDLRSRCLWAGTELAYIQYHDIEWESPSRDDQHLFEMLVLESMQSGLSWIAILRKRENFRRAFSNFDIAAVAKYNAGKIDHAYGEADRETSPLKHPVDQRLSSFETPQVFHKMLCQS